MMQNILVKLFVLCGILALVQCEKSGPNDNMSVEMLSVSFTANVQESSVNAPITFAGNASISGGEVSEWQWDFADGSPLATSKNVVHIFKFAGSYLVKLTVKSKSGKTAEHSLRIHIKNDSPPNYGNLISLKQKLSLLYPKVMVAAHRGYTSHYPENSLPSITDAAVNKINFAEIDVRLTSDNELVAMHDANTSRTTNQNVNIAEKTLQELKQLKLMHKGKITDFSIPTLRECLEAAKGKIYVTIDASKLNSTFFFNKIYNTVAAMNMVDMVLIYTTSAQAGESLLKMDPNIHILLGAGNATDYNNAANLKPGAVVWHLSSSTLSPLYTTEPTKAGIKFWANAYVNSTDVPPTTGNDPVVSNLTGNQVSIIQTDYPIEVIHYLQNQSLWLQ